MWAEFFDQILGIDLNWVKLLAGHEWGSPFIYNCTHMCRNGLIRLVGMIYCHECSMVFVFKMRQSKHEARYFFFYLCKVTRCRFLSMHIILHYYWGRGEGIVEKKSWKKSWVFQLQRDSLRTIQCRIEVDEVVFEFIKF